jgi:hypothetical protein
MLGIVIIPADRVLMHFGGHYAEVANPDLLLPRFGSDRIHNDSAASSDRL